MGLTCRLTCNSIPFDRYEKLPMMPNATADPNEQGNRMVTIFVNGITRLVNFLGELPRFQSLTTSDQKILLQNGT